MHSKNKLQLNLQVQSQFSSISFLFLWKCVKLFWPPALASWRCQLVMERAAFWLAESAHIVKWRGCDWFVIDCFGGLLSSSWCMMGGHWPSWQTSSISISEQRAGQIQPEARMNGDIWWSLRIYSHTQKVLRPLKTQLLKEIADLIMIFFFIIIIIDMTFFSIVAQLKIFCMKKIVLNIFGWTIPLIILFCFISCKKYSQCLTWCFPSWLFWLQSCVC